MKDLSYNIAFIGQTGVGKSTLINYLLGEVRAESGVGKPVTGKVFKEYKHKLKGIDINVYDSWGLEVGKHEEWRDLFRKTLSEHGVSKSPKEWFHTIIYCIGASGGRIQDADLDIIRVVVKENYPVAIALTKADLITEDDENKLLTVLKNEFGESKKILIGSVCSESKVTRAGKSEPFGKDVIEKIILDHVAVSISLKLPDYLYEQLSKELERQRSLAFKIIENETGFFSDDVESKLKIMFAELNDTLAALWASTIQDVLSAYGGILGFISDDLMNEYGFKREYFQGKYPASIFRRKGLFEGLAITILMPVFVLIAKESKKDSYREMVNSYVVNVRRNLRDVTSKLANQLNGDVISRQPVHGSSEMNFPVLINSLLGALGFPKAL